MGLNCISCFPLKIKLYLYQEMLRQGILNWQSKQAEENRQSSSSQDQHILQLQVRRHKSYNLEPKIAVLTQSL
jgi:hypothetical protein